MIFLFVAALGAFFMAFNNGANDVANSFASAVGSKAITVKQALLIASIMNLLGALLLGSHVAARLIEEVIHPEMFANPVDYVIAMVSVMAAAGSFVLFSSLTGMPVSSSHAIVASLTGVSIAVAGWASVNWPLIGVIVAVLGHFASSRRIAGLVNGMVHKAVRRELGREWDKETCPTMGTHPICTHRGSRPVCLIQRHEIAACGGSPYV